MRNILKRKINIGINHYGEISLFAQGKHHTSSDKNELNDSDRFITEKDALESQDNR